MQDYRITMDLCSSDLNAPLAAYNADQCEAFNSAASMPLRGCATTRKMITVECEKALINYLMNTYTEFINERYRTRKDKDNIYPVGVSDAEFREFIIDYLLGRDWYVVDPLSTPQTNEIALEKILKKYSKEYRKEVKKYEKLER